MNGFNRAMQITMLVIWLGLTGTIRSQDPAEHRSGYSGLRYPQRVEIPDGIPSVSYAYPKPSASRRSRPEIVIPPAIYLEGHYDGWQEFLQQIIERGMRVVDEKYEPLGRSENQEYSAKGRRDGFEACRQNVRRLLESIDGRTLVSLAIQASAPRYPPPPPAPTR